MGLGQYSSLLWPSYCLLCVSYINISKERLTLINYIVLMKNMSFSIKENIIKNNIPLYPQEDQGFSLKYQRNLLLLLFLQVLSIYFCVHCDLHKLYTCHIVEKYDFCREKTTSCACYKPDCLSLIPDSATAQLLLSEYLLTYIRPGISTSALLTPDTPPLLH